MRRPNNPRIRNCRRRSRPRSPLQMRLAGIILGMGTHRHRRRRARPDPDPRQGGPDRGTGLPPGQPSRVHQADLGPGIDRANQSRSLRTRRPSGSAAHSPGHRASYASSSSPTRRSSGALVAAISSSGKGVPTVGGRSAPTPRARPPWISRSTLRASRNTGVRPTNPLIRPFRPARRRRGANPRVDRVNVNGKIHLAHADELRRGSAIKTQLPSRKEAFLPCPW